MKTEIDFGKACLRILDANYNRAKEALRVSEDFSRFLMEDKTLTADFKRARHQMTKILLRFPVRYARLVASRDSVRDIGKKNLIHDRRSNPGWRDIMTANMKRAQEALRVLEELSKVVSPPGSRAFERLRFHIYELEKRSFRKF